MINQSQLLDGIIRLRYTGVTGAGAATGVCATLQKIIMVCDQMGSASSPTLVRRSWHEPGEIVSKQLLFTHKGSFYLAGHGDKEVGLLDVGFGYGLSVNQDLACV